LSKRTKKLLEQFAVAATTFYPDLTKRFICPTCLSHIALSEATRVTEAHIIPKSAGGGLVTLLCGHCNSAFGSKQDKWLAEYLYLDARGSGSAFHTRHQEGQFKIGGIRVGGTFRDSGERGIELFIRDERTSPTALAKLDSLLAKRPEELEVRVPLPLLKNERLLNVGLLTAAYLLWFRSWTYSWALQQHLDPIRSQILQPYSVTIDPKRYRTRLGKPLFDTPSIGVGLIDGRPCLFASIAKYLVILPPASSPFLYEELPPTLEGLTFRALRELTSSAPNRPIPPTSLFYRDGLLIGPDVMQRNPAKGTLFALSEDGHQVRELHPVSDEDFERLKAAGGQVTQIALPRDIGETGKPRLQ
jgi:hypothetical protein